MFSAGDDYTMDHRVDYWLKNEKQRKIRYRPQQWRFLVLQSIVISIESILCWLLSAILLIETFTAARMHSMLITIWLKNEKKEKSGYAVCMKLCIKRKVLLLERTKCNTAEKRSCEDAFYALIVRWIPINFCVEAIYHIIVFCVYINQLWISFFFLTMIVILCSGYKTGDRYWRFWCLQS